jgi:hypothetical protein
MTPERHYARAQFLISQMEQSSPHRIRTKHEIDDLTARAYLHLRAAEVGAALPRRVRSVADSISAASLSQPVAGFGPTVGGMTPGQVAGIVQETIAAEKRRGTIR